MNNVDYIESRANYAASLDALEHQIKSCVDKPKKKSTSKCLQAYNENLGMINTLRNYNFDLHQVRKKIIQIKAVRLAKTSINNPDINKAIDKAEKDLQKKEQSLVSQINKELGTIYKTTSELSHAYDVNIDFGKEAYHVVKAFENQEKAVNQWMTEEVKKDNMAARLNDKTFDSASIDNKREMMNSYLKEQEELASRKVYDPNMDKKHQEAQAKINVKSYGKNAKAVAISSKLLEELQSRKSTIVDYQNFIERMTLLKPIDPGILATIDIAKAEIARLEKEAGDIDMKYSSIDKSGLEQAHQEHILTDAKRREYEQLAAELSKANPNPVRTYEEEQADKKLREDIKEAEERIRIDRERAVYEAQYGSETSPSFSPRL